MPSVDRKWLAPALIALAAVVSAAAYRQLPPMIDLPFHALLPFTIDEPADRAPRWIALSLMPALALLVWAAFRLAPTAAGQRLGRRMFRRAPDAVTDPAEFDRYTKTYEAIVLGVVVLILGIHAAILAMAWEAPQVAVRIVPAVLGGCLVLMGNVMPRLRPNWVAGIRTQQTLEDPRLWRSTHRAFGRAFVASGIVTIVTAVVAPQFGFLVGLVGIAASSVVGFLATRRRDTATPAAIVAIGLLCISSGAVPTEASPAERQSFEMNAPEPTRGESDE
jgi:hypothetical protein